MLTQNHQLKQSVQVIQLAKRYYAKYRELGGIYNWDTSICVDFLIVACAAINGLDIVYSADNKTLRGSIAMNSYITVNKEECLKSPKLLSYSQLLKKFRRII